MIFISHYLYTLSYIFLSFGADCLAYIFLRNIFIRNQQNYIMNSRSERHEKYSDNRTDKKNKKRKRKYNKGRQ